VTTNDPLNALAALPGVAAEVESVRRSVDRLYGHRVMRRRASEVTAEAALRGARSSAACEGADWALEEVRRRTDFGASPQARALGAALRLNAEVGPLLEVWRRTPLQVLARFSLLAGAPEPDAGVAGAAGAAGASGHQHLGRPRSGAELPASPRPADGADEPGGRGDPAGPEPVEARPEYPSAPSAAEAVARLGALGELIGARGGERGGAPALVLAAVVHGELAAVRPFPDANGLIARAAQRISLTASGLDPKAICPAEVGLAELGAARYAQALRGYADGSPEGVAAWITYCGEVLRLGVRESVAVCEAMQRGML
jgi:hypothetical protein